MNKNSSGFTLIEMVIYIGLLTIFLVVLTSIFLSALDVRSESEISSSLIQDGRAVLSRLTYDIHRATSIVSPLNIGDVSTSLLLDINGLTYTYSVTGSNLVLNDNTSTDQINGFSTRITGFSVKRLGNANGKNTLQVSYTVNSTNELTAVPEQKQYKTTIGIR